MPDPDSHLLLSFNGACSIPGTVCFSGSSLQQDKGIPVETEYIPLSWRYKVTRPSQWEVPQQIPVDNTFPRCDGIWCSQQHSTLIHSESQDSGCFPRFPYLYGIRYLGRVPQSDIRGNRLYWVVIQMY